MSGIEFALGFIAGEASLGVNTKKASNGKWYCRPYLKIGLDSKDDAILWEIWSTFDGAGRVREKRGGDVIAWEVENSENLETVVQKIDNSRDIPAWEVSDKNNTYQTWRKIVEIYTEDEQTNDQQRVNMVHIAKQEGLNVGSGRQEVDYQRILDYYAENRNTYPEDGLTE